MKKAVVCFIVLVFAGFILRYFVLYRGFYIDLHPEQAVEAVFRADETQLYVQRDGVWTPFVAKGVIVDSCIPGFYSSDYAATQKQYAAWLTQISDMGANLVSVYTTMDPDFYNALQKHNEASAEPLYLLQGVSIADYKLNNARDMYAFRDSLLADAKRTVDVIHGNRIASLGRLAGGGNYISDVSQWTLGYLLGLEWFPYTIAYTDHEEELSAVYAGDYFYTTQDATASEAMLAGVMDEVMSYESHRYKQQRLISFSNSLSTDPLEYSVNVQMQLDKCARLDIGHVQKTDAVGSGLFASFIMRSGMNRFMECLSDGDRMEYASVLTKVDETTIYDGYVDFLCHLYDMPVLITGFGYSTARSIAEESGDGGWWRYGRLNENEQGEAIVETYRAFLEAGCQGAVIGTWQDNWSRTTWNTRYAIDEERERNWYDAQSVENGFGILAFMPGETESVCTVDGDSSEWDNADVVANNGAYALSVRQDAGWLYLMVKSANGAIGEPLAIPIDTTDRSGSTSVSGTSLRFNRYADFLILLNGAQNSRILIQRRYDGARMEYEERISGENPFISVPALNTDEFVPVRNVLRVPLDPAADLLGMNREEKRAFSFYGTTDTGELRHGNADENSAAYDSLADFCYGTDCVELRIAWQLLNVSDPSGMRIHDDYYPVYGLKDMEAEIFYFGIGRQNEVARIYMNGYALETWDTAPVCRERLKRSYEVIRREWTGG